MNNDIEKQIQDKIPLIKDKINILHFSTGADSIASFLRLREFGIEPICIYNYFLPHIPMVDNYIDYFEKEFNTHVYRMPSILYSEYTDKVLFQKPIEMRRKMRADITCFELYKNNHSDKMRRKIIKLLQVKNEDIVFHKGIKYTDGASRYHTIKDNGVYHKDCSFYPIASFQVKDIQEILEKYNCKLPIEYALWGISFEAPRSFNMRLIKENCPKSYEYILNYFPLSNTLQYRDNYNKLNQHFKRRVTQFSKYAIDKSLFKEW